MSLAATFATDFAIGGIDSAAWSAFNGVLIGTCGYIGARAHERRKHDGPYSGMSTSASAPLVPGDVRGNAEDDDDHNPTAR